MHLLIPYWHRCNNKCVMCTNPVEIQPRDGVCFDAGSLREFVEEKKKHWREVRTVYITGGETTMRPDFFEALSYISESFPLAQISILSNGRRFFYVDFAKRCLSYPSIDFIIPVHGWDSRSHDKVTGIRGSFEQTITGLENLFALRRPDQRVEIRIIIHKINYKKADKILDLISKKFPSADKVVLVFIEYEGHAIENLKLVKLTYEDFLPLFRRLEKHLKKFKEIRFYHFPLCVMPKKFWPHMWRTLEADETTFLPKCAKCKVRKFCLGIHKTYLELFGESEFKPFKKAVKCKENKHNKLYNPIASIQ